MAQFANKLVAVLNKNAEPGRLMNALAHMAIGLGAAIEKPLLELSTYVDADKNEHPFISNIPFIILRANSSKIAQLRAQAIEANIKFTNFTHTMTEGTYLDQLERTAQTYTTDLTYFGIVLFGEWDKVSELTRKFSLWR